MSSRQDKHAHREENRQHIRMIEAQHITPKETCNRLQDGAAATQMKKNNPTNWPATGERSIQGRIKTKHAKQRHNHSQFLDKTKRAAIFWEVVPTNRKDGHLKTWPTMIGQKGRRRYDRRNHTLFMIVGYALVVSVEKR
jgi:hypothetical protein